MFDYFVDMDVELQKFNESHNLSELQKYVSTLSSSFISSELSKVVWQNDGAAIVQTLFNGLAGSAMCFKKKMQIYEAILYEIEKKQLPARIGEKLVDVLTGEVDSFSIDQLIRLAEVCCDMIRNPSKDSKFSCWKELLPKVLFLIVNKSMIEHCGSQMTGEEYKCQVISSLCLLEWSSSVVVDLAAMFIEMPLNKEERVRVVKKLCSTMSTLPPDAMPPLVHQLMGLAKNEHAVTFFMALAQYFKTNLYDKIEHSISSSAMRSVNDAANVEGTVLYHIVHSEGQLGFKEILKHLKQCLNVPQFVLQPFFVTMLLSLASSLPSSEDEALTILRAGFARALAENERISESTWLRTVLPSPVNVTNLVNRVLEHCLRSQDIIVKGLITLGFNLLAAGRGSDHLHAIGIAVLEDLVKRNKLFMSIVLEKLGNQFSLATDLSQYTDCLVKLTRKQPLFVTENSPVVMQLIESCNELPTKTGTHILAALLPLAQLSTSIRDNLMTLLCKSLWLHDVDRQIMGVSGFLELLRDLKISNLQNLSQSMSQNFCNISQLCSQSLTGGASKSNEGLCLEVLGVLSGVLKQEHQVKTVLYKGIYSAVRANPELGPHSLDCLQTHLMKWFEPDETAPPLLFDKTVTIQNDKAVLVEPLGDLILCFGLMAVKLGDSNRSVKLMEKLDSICLRISTATLSTFHLEMGDGTILDSTPEANKKQEILRQILGVYEALMGYLLCTWSKSDKSECFFNLFKGYTLVTDFARSLGKTDKKQGEKRQRVGEKMNVFRFPTTILNFKCCTRLLQLINKNDTDETTVQLKGKRELHRYATQVAVQVIRDARALHPIELARDCHNLGYLSNIGRTLFKSYVSRLAESKAFDLPATLTALQAFADLLNLIISHFKPKLSNFLNEIAGESVSSQDTIALHAILNTLLDQLDDVLGEETQEEDVKEDQQAKKMPVLYLAVVSSLVNEVAAGSAFAVQAFEKINQICLKRKIERPGEAKAILTLLFTLHRRYQDSQSLVFNIALSLCSEMDLIDDEIEVQEHDEYKIVNRKTANVCLLALCEALQVQLSDVEWTVNRFKAEAILLAYPSDEPIERRKDELRNREIKLCRHVKNCARAVSTICTIAAPSGPASDSVLKCLETCYSKFSLLTKYFTAKVAKFQENLELTKFDKTVQIIDSELTKNMYCFTEHVIKDRISDSRSNKPSLLKQRVVKETKLIPKVIQEKEQYHKLLLQLSKRAKIDLASKTKNVLTRDYRLYAGQAREVIQNERTETQDDEFETDADETMVEESAVDTVEVDVVNTVPDTCSPISAKRKRSVEDESLSD